MVHPTVNSSSASASSASSRITSMGRTWAWLAIVGTLAGCASTPLPPMDEAPRTAPPAIGAPAVAGEPIAMPRSRWVPAAWSELPGFAGDNLYEAWNAWLKGCERPPANWVRLCGGVRRLSIASGDEQRAWMVQNLQPYRVEPIGGPPDG